MRSYNMQPTEANPGTQDADDLEGAEIDVGPLFSMVPEALTFDKDLSDRGARVYAAIHRYGNASGRRFPAAKTLAKRLGKAPNTVRRAQADLVAAGWMSVTHRSGRSNLVKLHQEKQGVPKSGQGGVPKSGQGGLPKSGHRPRASNREQSTDSAAGSEIAATPRERAETAAASEREPQTVMALVLARLSIDRDPSASETRMTAKALDNGWTLDDLLDRAASADTTADPYAWTMRALGAMATSEPDWGPRIPPADRTNPPTEPEDPAAIMAEFAERLGVTVAELEDVSVLRKLGGKG